MCEEIGDRWVWSGRTSDTGSPRFYVGGKDNSVYRLAYCIHKGISESEITGKVVWPTTEQRDINPAHLMAGSMAEMRVWERLNGKTTRGISTRARLTKGARSRASTRLTPELAKQIRESEETSLALAARLGCSPSTVRDVRRRRTWRETVARSSVFEMGAV